MGGVALLVALLVGAAACGGSGPPARPADLTGEITRVSGAPGRMVVLVEEHPGQASGDRKAAVTLESTTRILRSSGGAPAPAGEAELRVGVRVSVWFGGPVAQSYPVQGRAEAVLINASP